METIGQKLSPVLIEIESALWDHEAEIGTPPQFTDEAFRAASKIFMACLMDKMWTLQEAEKLTMETRCAMSETAGQALRQMVKTYTGIDTFAMYNNSK